MLFDVINFCWTDIFSGFSSKIMSKVRESAKKDFDVCQHWLRHRYCVVFASKHSSAWQHCLVCTGNGGAWCALALVPVLSGALEMTMVLPGRCQHWLWQCLICSSSGKAMSVFHMHQLQNRPWLHHWKTPDYFKNCSCRRKRKSLKYFWNFYFIDF